MFHGKFDRCFRQSPTYPYNTFKQNGVRFAKSGANITFGRTSRSLLAQRRKFTVKDAALDTLDYFYFSRYFIYSVKLNLSAMTRFSRIAFSLKIQAIALFSLYHEDIREKRSARVVGFSSEYVC